MSAQVQELLDREAIRDCLYRYCRGIDRAEEAALRSAYWPDGTDDHGPYKGSASGFVDWAMQTLPTIEQSVHQIHNVLITFREGGAAVESYFTALQRQPGRGGAVVNLQMEGRYLDWFEKRGDEWRILNRTVVFDWIQEQSGPAPGKSAGRGPVSGRWPDDPVYELVGQTPPLV
ncbi:nuclear transport factor 2 family protein [Phenylobacterium conjunctum]|uniref:Nuclear transport factor 2 family protein n=1 Tax=Phenylobacterium conjunctum TaxID=1298959 RepID=A0ABW3T2T3_9CAUL